MSRTQDRLEANLLAEKLSEKKGSIYSTEQKTLSKTSHTKTHQHRTPAKNFISMNKHKVKGTLMEYAKSIRSKPTTTMERLSSKLNNACSRGAKR